MCTWNRRRAAGFSLVEGAVAAFVLAVGLLSAAMLTSQMLATTNRAKYISAASILASEKLEDLSRWPADDPHVTVPGGGAVGSLGADLTQDVTVGGVSSRVNYYDEVTMSLEGGTFAQTVSGVDPGGQTVYTTTTHAPDGSVVISTSSEPPALVTFKRRWTIEQDVPIPGVRRITVQVALMDQSVRPPVVFQMSMVRP